MDAAMVKELTQIEERLEILCQQLEAEELWWVATPLGKDTKLLKKILATLQPKA